MNNSNVKTPTTYLDTVKGLKLKAHIWKGVGIISLIIAAVCSTTVIYLFSKLEKKFVNQRLVLVPALERRMDIPANSYLSESYVRGLLNRIVNLNEQWTYLSAEDNFKELFQNFYDKKLEEITEANILKTKRFSFLKNQKVVSIFKIDKRQSKYQYCEKIGAACGVIVGRRQVFVDHNKPYSDIEVSYFITGQGVWPDDNNPFALRINRLVTFDSPTAGKGENARNGKKYFNAAVRGKLEE